MGRGRGPLPSEPREAQGTPAHGRVAGSPPGNWLALPRLELRRAGLPWKNKVWRTGRDEASCGPLGPSYAHLPLPAGHDPQGNWKTE